MRDPLKNLKVDILQSIYIDIWNNLSPQAGCDKIFVLLYGNSLVKGLFVSFLYDSR